jgi:hypothetical protein
VTPSAKVRNGGSSGSDPQSGVSQNGSSRGGPKAIISVLARSCATIVALPNSAFPQVWSPWWWVLTRVRTGAVVTEAMASTNARVRRSVEQESTATTPRGPTAKPVLLIHHVPSGWM